MKTNRWTLAAIDSAIERGNLADWRELFGAARENRQIAEQILKIAAKPNSDGAAKLAKSLVERMYPELLK